MSGVYDLWRRRDGTPSARDGQGLRYRVRVDGYPSTSHRTRVEAEAVLRERLVAGPPRQTSSVTVGEAVKVWLAGKQGLSPKGVEACRVAAAHILARWRDVRVDHVDPREVQIWLAGLTTSRGEPASASLRQKVRQAMRGALSGRVDLSGLAVRREQRREGVFLTVEQVALVAAELGPIVWLLATTGLRIGEACALRVGDVDAKRRRVRVRVAKSGRGRDVPLSAAVLGLLDLGRPADAPLFVNSRGGHLRPDVWRAKHWRPAVERLGIEARPHDLRHTAASLAIASGADVKVVQRMLGHASAAMTLDLYGHLWDRGLDDVADRMGDLVSTAGVLRAAD